MAELKQCPFCDGIPTNPFYYDPYDGYQGNLGSYIIKCTNCRAEIQRGTKEEVTEAWNRRAEA